MVREVGEAGEASCRVVGEPRLSDGAQPGQVEGARFAHPGLGIELQVVLEHVELRAAGSLEVARAVARQGGERRASRWIGHARAPDRRSGERLRGRQDASPRDEAGRQRRDRFLPGDEQGPRRSGRAAEQRAFDGEGCLVARVGERGHALHFGDDDGRSPFEGRDHAFGSAGDRASRHRGDGAREEQGCHCASARGATGGADLQHGSDHGAS